MSKYGIIILTFNTKINAADSRIAKGGINEYKRLEKSFLRSICSLIDGRKTSCGLHSKQHHDVQKASMRVGNEAHRFKGILRFSIYKNGVSYSCINPQNDIIEFLAPHFCDRLGDAPFIIHDEKRKKAVIANGGKWYITDFEASFLPPADGDEENFRRLWREYFDEISISQRKNRRCQINFIPALYWKNLTEMQSK